MSSILVALCSFSCVFSCFTDCFKGTDGSRKYGTVTKKGLWTYADPGSVDLSKYKIRIADFVHAVFVVSVFGTLVLLDRKVTERSTPSFSISINGRSGAFFKSTKGIRQGDPLSSHLFVLAMEAFSRLPQFRFESWYISFHPRTKELKTTHLMFVDKVMIFFDGNSSLSTE
ncbi:hypothetical protein Bca4012_090115 [Brassica carinata]